jgi:outer membrane immunogenic protein
MKLHRPKRVLLCVAVTAAWSGSAALAADLPVKAPVPQASPPFNWEGFHVGVNAGYGWGTADSQDSTLLGAPAGSMSPKGGFGGIQAGYNSMLTPHWLLGTEFDFDWGDLNASTLAARTSGPTAPTQISVRYFGTIRERFGFVLDRSLIYATGGVAWAQGDWLDKNIVGLPGSIGDDHVGWTAGVGYEYAFAPRWSAKVEYLYANLGQWRVTSDFVTGGLRTVDLKLNTVKFGVNYHLDDAPAAATVMPVKAPRPPWSWAGSYVGINAGYGWGAYSVSNNIFSTATQDPVALSPHGLLGGFQGGYNWLLRPAWLLGVESDFDFGSLNANGASAVGGFASNLQINNFATVRGRVGYVAGPALLYATGGFAYAQEKAFIATFLPTTTKFYHLGWTVGAGVEYMFAPRWSAKFEYLYARFDSTLSDTAGFDLATRPTLNLVRAGVNYKFDWADLLGR